MFFLVNRAGGQRAPHYLCISLLRCPGPPALKTLIFVQNSKATQPHLRHTWQKLQNTFDIISGASQHLGSFSLGAALALPESVRRNVFV
jgi:hypothetical protein